MKTAAIVVTWCVLAVVLVYLLLGPQTNLLQATPLNTLGLGLIGLGICLETRKRQSEPQPG